MSENNQIQQNPDDKGGFGWGLLGFCIPIVGLVLWLVWKNDKPITAKVAGKGALISVCIGIVLWILNLILTIFMAGAGY